MSKTFDLTDDQKAQGIEAIKVFFAEERDEDLGDLASMLILDFICETFGPYFYNIGLNDAKGFVMDKLDDIYGMEK